MTAPSFFQEYRAMTKPFAPKNPLPWHMKPGLPAVYDANGAVVSFQHNADFLMDVANWWHAQMIAMQGDKSCS